MIEPIIHETDYTVPAATKTSTLYFCKQLISKLNQQNEIEFFPSTDMRLQWVSNDINPFLEKTKRKCHVRADVGRILKK